MTRLQVADDEILALPHVTEDVHGLRLLFVNVYGIAGPHGWVLVDAGLRGTAARIRRWAAQTFGSEPPSAIVLTHAHFDHVGALEELLEQWDVPVYAHRLEQPYLSGARAYPPPDPKAGAGLVSRLSPLFPRGPIDVRHRLIELPVEGRVPGLPDWQWLHTPGHTPGHISLFRGSDRTLLPGDAFCTTAQESVFAVARQRPELHGPPAYFTSDWAAAGASVRRLAAWGPRTIAPGHGQPMAGPETARALQALARRFGAPGHPPPRATGPGGGRRPPLTARQHAMLDYAVAGVFFAVGAHFSSRHRDAARLAYVNGAMVLGLSLLTNYPGGAYRTLSFKAHRAGDVVQAAMAALGPTLLGFGAEPEARFFRWQAASEFGVIAATDWESAS